MQMRNALVAIAIASALYAQVAAAGGDINNGADVFNAQCSICHSMKAGKNKLGPSLAGILETPAGAVANYAFSTAMKNSHVTWNKETLNTFLTNPGAMIPGNKMPYPGLADEQSRKDLIAYLRAPPKK